MKDVLDPARAHITNSNDNLHVQSPDAIESTHPGARETDPFFTNSKNLTQDQAEEGRNPTRSFGTSMNRSLSPESTWQPDLSSAKSAHPMAPPAIRRGSTSVSIGGRSAGGRSLTRRGSSTSQRRVPTRTDSGREFWGLPEAPHRPHNTFEDVPEDSSEDEEEWVRGVFTVLSI